MLPRYESFCRCLWRRPLLRFEAGSSVYELGRQTRLMGILNVTPDSFSDGGCYLDPSAAEKKALLMQEEGADFLDIGGESSRPGARAVSPREEMRRILPVLKRLSKKIKIPISIDTAKYEVALAALEHGARIVNDITALSGDRRMGKLIGRYEASVILMHMKGKPGTMQKRPAYRDVLTEVKRSLKNAVQKALDSGIPKERVVVDPGFGFGKSVEHNLELLNRLNELREFKLPVLVGLSRKSFLGHLLGVPTGERLTGSLAAASVAIERGAHILRVHDVGAHRQLALLVDRMKTLRK